MKEIILAFLLLITWVELEGQGPSVQGALFAKVLT